ncbi:MAG TPA: hypothetical protein DEO60_05280 [Bacteroidales bacterium]|nr:hypothetical protein [Bacteroidales bacterium]
MVSEYNLNMKLTMQKCHKLIYLVVLALGAASCSMNKSLTGSKAIIGPLSEKTVVSEGSLVYGLPLTVIDIEIETERVVEKPGPYSRFAADLLGLTDVIKSENELWTITGITLRTHEEPDPEQFYVIEASNFFQTNVLAIRKSGLIMDLNPELYNSLGDIDQNSRKDKIRPGISDLGSDEYFQSRKDTLYRIVNVDTAFVRIPYLVEKKQKLSIDQLAAKAAARLMELRDGKHLILTGETNLFPQDEAAIKEMNRLEKEYTELFTGKIVKDKQRFSYSIIPHKNESGSKVTVCRFSDSVGVIEPGDKSGLPVNLEFIPEMNTRNLNIIYGKSGSATSQKYDKLFYRVPDVVNVRVTIGNEVRGISRKLIYQFGEIIRLPANYIIGK